LITLINKYLKRKLWILMISVFCYMLRFVWKLVCENNIQLEPHVTELSEPNNSQCRSPIAKLRISRISGSEDETSGRTDITFQFTHFMQWT
jgi:hypothetical protein